eukprot:2031274-Rhodomonas_salina.3
MRLFGLRQYPGYPAGGGVVTQQAPNRASTSTSSRHLVVMVLATSGTSSTLYDYSPRARGEFGKVQLARPSACPSARAGGFLLRGAATGMGRIAECKDVTKGCRNSSAIPNGSSVVPSSVIQLPPGTRVPGYQ